ncbi:MAG: glycosyltransferase family 4 protein [Ignavibacterium sp.]|jgi:glycosyltransferase involved in cell wall biosynthesis|nr:glycosyltransferase family 4 protein [Ignavibacterium sp.]
MKVLYSCLSKSWGGMEMVAITGIKQLLKHNIKVGLLCLAESRIQIEANALGIIIYPIKSNRTPNIFSSLRIISIIKSGSFDIIHSHSSKDLWVIVPALNFLKSGIPLVFTKHLESFIIKKNFLHNWIYKRVDCAIAISSVIKLNLLKTTSLKESKIKIVYNGVDLEKFNPKNTNRNKLRDEIGAEENNLLIGMTGRFSPGKGHEDFLLAINRLNKKYPEAKYVVVGEASRGEDEYEKNIKHLAEEYGIKNITFTGYRTDIPDVLAAFDIYVFPSHAESFGVGLIEAMALCKASVASNSSGVLDIVDDTVDGLFFNSKDGYDLAAKIEVLINNSELRKRLGENARKKISDKFDLNLVTEQIVNTYKQLIK